MRETFCWDAAVYTDSTFHRPYLYWRIEQTVPFARLNYEFTIRREVRNTVPGGGRAMKIKRVVAALAVLGGLASLGLCPAAIGGVR